MNAGLWPAFRGRPFGKTPPPAESPHSIFVTAIDTDPLAPDPVIGVGAKPEFFRYGLQLLPHLTDGPVYLCTAPGANLPGGDLPKIEVREFAGPHPAGLAGTHIHVLDPVQPREDRVARRVSGRDRLRRTVRHRPGQLRAAGEPRRPAGEEPAARHHPDGGGPRRGDGRRTEGGGEPGDLRQRVRRPRPPPGPRAVPETRFLGRYANTISVLLEGHEREFLGWQKPGFDKFSVRRIFASAVTPGRSMNFTTSTGGSRRAMVPIGMYEQVMPLDIEPTFLLRALVTDDTEQAQLLGALELIEEDVGPLTFVCPGKTDYGPLLRRALDTIEEEG